VAQRHRVVGAVAEAFAAEAAWADALREADRSIVLAPTGGQIGEIGVEQGRWVHAGAAGVAPTTLLVITSTGPPEVEVRVEQRQAARVQVGQDASVTLEALSPRPLRARVVSRREVMSEGIDGTARLRLRLEERPHGVRVGLRATVRISIEERFQVPAIPNHAVRSESAGRAAPQKGTGARATRTETAWVIADGLVGERRLLGGLRGDTHTEVLAGLTLGESVITGPYALVRSIGVGDAVIPVPAPIVSR
jgi:HlyD family secretion protein